MRLLHGCWPWLYVSLPALHRPSDPTLTPRQLPSPADVFPPIDDNPDMPEPNVPGRGPFMESRDSPKLPRALPVLVIRCGGWERVHGPEGNADCRLIAASSVTLYQIDSVLSHVALCTYAGAMPRSWRAAAPPPCCSTRMVALPGWTRSVAMPAALPAAAPLGRSLGGACLRRSRRRPTEPGVWLVCLCVLSVCVVCVCCCWFGFLGALPAASLLVLGCPWQ